MQLIAYVQGDATRPTGSGPRILAHVVNDAGGWGRGFVLALSKRWKAPEQAYRAWRPLVLGATQFVEVEPNLLVANMVAQHRYGGLGLTPLRYDALAACLTTVAAKARELGASVHGPRFGAGLAGGEWTRVEALLLERLPGLDATIYDPPSTRP